MWGVTSAVAVFEVSLVKDIAVSAYLYLQRDNNMQLHMVMASSLAKIVTAVAGVIAAVFVTASGEFYSQNAGGRRAWRFFGWTIATELLIATIYGLTRLIL